MPDQQYDGVILEDKWGKTYLCSSCLLAYADLGDDVITDVLDKEYGRYFLHALEPYWNLRQIWLEMYQHAKPWAYDFSRLSDFQLRDALLKLLAAGELRIWQLAEGWGQPPEGNGIGEGGLVMTGNSAAPGTSYKKVLQPGGAADTESIGVVDAAIGVADLMATGLVNTGVDIVAGGAGLVTLAISGGDVDAAVHTIESVQENQVGPFTQAGEDVAKVVAPVVDEYYEQNMAAIGEKTLEVTDSPMLAMAAHKSVELVGTVMGAGVVGNAVKRAAKVDVDVDIDIPNSKASLPKVLQQQKELSILTNQTRNDLVNDFDALLDELTPGQIDAIAEEPWRMQLYFGTALESRVARLVDNLVQDNPDHILSDLTWTQRTNAPQDFYDPDGFGFDITGGSASSILKHQNRAEVDAVISYDSIPSDLGYKFINWLNENS